jgi:hypothetical protein
VRRTGDFNLAQCEMVDMSGLWTLTEIFIFLESWERQLSGIYLRTFLRPDHSPGRELHGPDGQENTPPAGGKEPRPFGLALCGTTRTDLRKLYISISTASRPFQRARWEVATPRLHQGTGVRSDALEHLSGRRIVQPGKSQNSAPSARIREILVYP